MRGVGWGEEWDDSWLWLQASQAPGGSCVLRPFTDFQLRDRATLADISQQPVLSASMCPITVTRVSHDERGHGNRTLLCQSRTHHVLGTEPAPQRSERQEPACPKGRGQCSLGAARGGGCSLAPRRRARSGHPGDNADTGLAPMGRELTLPCLLLSRQCTAQLAQERLVLLHLGGPRGGRLWWRGGHMRVHGTHRRPGSGQEGAAAASPPLPTDPEVPVLQLSSRSQSSGTLRVVCQARPAPFCAASACWKPRIN